MPLKYNRKIILDVEVVEVPGDEDGATIMLFHGFGANAYDLVPLSQAYRISPKPTWYFPTGPLEIPISQGYSGRAWFPIDFEIIRKAIQEHNTDLLMQAFPTEIDTIRTKCEQMIGELNIPRSLLFVGGFSQGAVLATDLALHSFQKLAGLIIFSGTMYNEKKWQTLAHNQAGLPFFQSHGESDPLLPFREATNLETLLKKGGLKGQLNAFKGGHEIPQSVIIKLNQFLTKYLAPK